MIDINELRRLLELAAKAAGIKFDKSPYNGGGRGNNGFDVCGNAVLDWHNGVTWNPLADDGDAFRLACDLGLRVFTVARTESGAACSAVGDVTGERLSEIADMLPTRTATRLAIVRAAAAIGEKMEEEE